MKRFLTSVTLLCALIVFTNSHSPSQDKNYVLDQSHILTDEQNNKLNTLYISHEKKTTNQIALVTTDTFDPDSTIESYSLRVFNELGVGQKDKNNGVLIVFSAPKKQVRIATGLGTEKVLTDSIAKRIIDSLMLPKFKQQKFFEGLWDGSLAITNFLEKPENLIR
jgi:uncharacterized protein